MKNRLIFVTGGGRSGKSRYAQTIADEIKGRKLYLATAHALDDEMKSRIEIHRMDRPAGWNTVEETKHLSKAVKEIDKKFDVILIDCITMWISNLLVIEGFSETEIMKELEYSQPEIDFWQRIRFMININQFVKNKISLIKQIRMFL